MFQLPWLFIMKYNMLNLIPIEEPWTKSNISFIHFWIVQICYNPFIIYVQVYVPSISCIHPCTNYNICLQSNVVTSVTDVVVQSRFLLLVI